MEFRRYDPHSGYNAGSMGTGGFVRAGSEPARTPNQPNLHKGNVILMM